ncbi:MAG: hypothetical protein JXB47_04095 [Anaerolineae bacterium]|nr:hypothetical protein [Anaerolineae bacterium]
MRGSPDENGWITWCVVAGPRVLYEVLVWEQSESLKRFALRNCQEIARQCGYHLHPDDLRRLAPAPGSDKR